MNTERNLYNYLVATSAYNAWTDSQLNDIIQLCREGLPSPAKLRLVEDELKSTKDSLEQVMLERDELERRAQALLDDNAVLALNLEKAMTAINEMTPVVIAAGEAAGGND